MDNLSTIIKTYFVDRDFDEIINSSRQNKPYAYHGMDRISFQDHFLAEDNSFGTDAVDSLCTLTEKYWLRRGNSQNVFNILANATKDMLIWKNDEPVCLSDQFLRWNEISRIVGEDLLTTAFLASNETSAQNEILSYAWKPFITSNNQIVNSIIQKGLYELHFHLNGSSLIFDINWLALMNGRPLYNRIKDIFPKKDQAKKAVLIFQKTVAIRFYLYLLVFKGNSSEIRETKKLLDFILQSKSEEELIPNLDNIIKSTNIHLKNSLQMIKGIDYAIPQEITSKDRLRYANVPLIGERILLYKAFKLVYNKGEYIDEFGNLLYAYIVAKNKFREILVQYDKKKGFSHFSDIEKRKQLFGNDHIYASLFKFSALHSTIVNQPIKHLEIRIAPSNNKNDLNRKIKSLNRSAYNTAFMLGNSFEGFNKAKIGIIIHFIKQAEDSNNNDCQLYCRNYTMRGIIRAQAIAIKNLVKENNPLFIGGYRDSSMQKPPVIPVVGIDAANSEFGCRPEVFAPAYRYLRYIHRDSSLIDNIQVKDDFQLNRTFHVGEDYYDVIDGLRAIDECINFLDFGNGDRLGHAVALGINAHKYYSDRRFHIVIPKQDLLDNLAWMFAKIEQYSISDENGIKNRIENHFRKLYFEIYHSAISLDTELENISIKDYYDSWKLRGDAPDTEPQEIEWQEYKINKNTKLNRLRETNKIKKLFHYYHYSLEAKKIGAECTEISIFDTDYKIIDEIQQKMREMIARLGISIETNPTSNMQITDVNRYSEHPIFKFNGNYLKPCQNSVLNVSINTDDQGVFATSLEKEFTLMAIALEKARDENGKHKYNKQNIYQWLDYIRESAKIQSFLN